MTLLSETNTSAFACGQLIHEHAEHLHVEDKGEYRVRVFGARRSDGVWQASLQFESDAGELRRMPIETTQPSRHALEFWATGLEPVYLEGAFRRSRPVAGGTA